jgi:hypothetical protein
MSELINRTDSKAKKNMPEYVVYSFLRGGSRRGSDPWQHMGALSDVSQARQLARSLFRTSRYSRIELRKKCISEKTGTVIDIPLEVLDHSPDRDIRTITIVLSLAIGCAFLALWVSLML